MGHTLVVPRRHVASLFDFSDDEQAALWRLVALVRAKLLADQTPDGFTVGVNDGPAAGLMTSALPRGNPSVAQLGAVAA